MKISKEDYESLKQAILPQHSPDMHGKYRCFGLSDERYRWDLLWISGFKANILYDKSLHDGHIDTALRKILKTGDGK